MKALYTVFNSKDPEDTSVMFDHENAKLMHEHLNSPWKDEDGKEYPPEETYDMGVETFRDEEWPLVQRVLAIAGISPEGEEKIMEVIKSAMEIVKSRTDKS